MTPTDVRDWLLEEGFRAKLDETNPEFATIETGADGIKFDINFNRVTPPDGDLDGFESITFITGMQLDTPPPVEKMNKINGTYRFVKVYSDEDGLFFEMDQVAFPETLDQKTFREMFYLWSSIVPDFIKIAE